MTLICRILLLSLFLPLGLKAETLQLYTWRTQERNLWKEINQRALIPGVTIEVKAISYDSYPALVHLGLQSGQVDLFQWAPGAAELAPLIKRNLIQPYEGDVSSLHKSALLASLGPDEKIYGVPFALQLQALIGNKKVIEKVTNAQQPQSLEELEQRFAALKNAGITPLQLAGKADWYVSQLLSEVLMAGLVDKAFAMQLVQGESCFTDTRYTNMFDVLQRWKNQGFINANVLDEDYVSLNSAVGLGQSAFAVEGGWKTGPSSHFFLLDAEYQFAFWAIPGKGNSIYALGDGSYQVNATSPRAVLANKVLDFTASKTFAEMFAKYVNELPAWGGSLAIEQPILREMANLVSQQAYPVGPFSTYDLNRGNPNYQQLTKEAFRAVLAGKMTSAEAGKHIQQGLNSWNYAGAENCR